MRYTIPLLGAALLALSGCGEADKSLLYDGLKKEVSLLNDINDSIILDENVAYDQITYDLNLPLTFSSLRGEITASWESSNRTWLNDDGEIVKPLSLGCDDENQSLRLSGTFGRDGVSVTKKYDLTLIENPQALLAKVKRDVNSTVLIGEDELDEMNLTNRVCGHDVVWVEHSPYFNLYPLKDIQLPNDRFDDAKVDVNATLHIGSGVSEEAFVFTIKRVNAITSEAILQGILEENDLNSSLTNGRYCHYRFNTNVRSTKRECYREDSGSYHLYSTAQYYYSIDSEGSIEIYTESARTTEVAEILNISSSEFRIDYTKNIPDIAVNQTILLSTEGKE